jgi:NADH-quinone oxidoreductase subunit E
MSDLILTSLGLMLAAFAIGAGLGWLLAGRAVSHHSAFEAAREPLRDAAEVFTAGVVVPFKAETAVPAPQPAPQPGRAPAYVPIPAPARFEMAAANVAIIRDDTSLQGRVSSLVAMTPESVEAAVQQAGSGLAPLRLDAPKGAPDDLTLISGITETSQQALNALGIYHFWQVAGWTPEHVAWLSSRVEAPGRIARENWMSQAARLSDKL